MANRNNGRDNNDSVRSIRTGLMREANKRIREKQVQCFHKNAHGPILDNPKKVNGLNVNLQSLSDSDLVCTECEEIVNLDSVTQEQFEAFCGVFYRMVNQSKVFCKFDESEAETLMEMERAFDSIKNVIWTFYEENVLRPMMGKGKNKGNNNNNGSNKGRGGIAISKGNFNRR